MPPKLLTILGKSVLCCSMVENLLSQKMMPFASYFCNYSPISNDTVPLFLRTIAAQLIKQTPELVTWVHQNYVEKAMSPSKKNMKDLLTQVLAGMQICRVLVDGVDECEESQRKEILTSILLLQQEAGSSCKLLIASRDEAQIHKFLRQSSKISLKGKTDHAIDLCIKNGISDLEQAFGLLDEGFVKHIQRQLSSKAGGASVLHSWLQNPLIIS